MNPIDYRPYAVEFLETAWSHDKFIIKEFLISEKLVTLEVQAAQYRDDGVSGFHLHSAAAMILLQQMGAIYARWINQDVHQSSLVTLTQFTIECKKAIRQTNNILFKGQVVKSRNLGQHKIYICDYSIQEQSYLGRASFLYSKSREALVGLKSNIN